MKCMHVYVLHTFFGIVCIYADDIAISGDIIYIYTLALRLVVHTYSPKVYLSKTRAANHQISSEEKCPRFRSVSYESTR